MIRICSLVLLLVGAWNLRAESIQFFEGTWQQALEAANNANKLVFVDIYTDWCAPCKKMNKLVFTDPKVAAFYNEKFINFRINGEKGEGIALAKKFDVSAYPALLYVALDQSIVHQLSGFTEPEAFIVEGKIALNPSVRMDALRQRFEAGERTPDFLEKYAYERFRAYDGSHSSVVDAYMKSISDWASNPQAISLIYDLTTDVRSASFKAICANKKIFYKQFEQNAVDNKIQDMVFGHIYKNELSLFEADKVLANAYPKQADLKQKKYRLKYFREKGDRINYARSAIQYFEKYKSDDAFEYLDAARAFQNVVEDKTQLKEAVRWTKRANRLEKHYENHEIMALLYLKLGDEKKALKAAQKAYDTAKLSNQQNQLDKNLLQLLKK